MKTISEVLGRPFGTSILGWLTALTFAGALSLAIFGGSAPPSTLEVFATNAFGVVLVLDGVNVVLLGLKSYDTATEIGSNDPVPAADVADAAGENGHVEVTGTAQSNGNVLQSEFTDTDCFVHRWKRYEREKQSSDNSTWELRGEGGHELPFVVADDSGTVRVDPQVAEVSLDTQTRPGFIARYLAGEKRTESRLDLGQTVHVYGAYLDGDDGRMLDPHIGASDDQPLRIADASEKRVVARHLGRGSVVGLVGVAIAVLGGAIVWAPPI